MKKNLLWLLTTLLFTPICAQEMLHITGRIEGITDSIKLVLSSGEQKEVFYTRDGKIEMSMYLNEAPAYVRLAATIGKDTKNAFFYLANETVNIEGTIDDFPLGIRAIGSEHDSLRYEHRQMTKDIERARRVYIDEYYKLLALGRDKDSVNTVYLSDVEPYGKISKLSKEIEVINERFIRQHINTDYGSRLLLGEVISYSDQKIKELYKLIRPEFYTNMNVALFKLYLDYKQLKEGNQYYDFTALDVNERQVKFSDYFKGKYVLLDFSTYGCGYCQVAGPKTAKIATVLESKLTYVTYYVYGGKTDALKYYEEFKGSKGILLWNNNEGVDPITIKYRLAGTPDYILFSPEGKFLKAFSGMQKDDFEQQLKELMKE
ncbi:TlpA family protein disulfide reductase [Myroides pelagicus]|uniref:Redoxin domain-containing protein n=1 Tax=Myroides pelagicus TaxID=270914 RepID=A0A7K1GKC3_9FLAO|nr:redoxin domain-containing protein [Myroides pelagicus]MEC4113028.1 redoxin domain-containing protein [Myroides pelagicus]MTH28969.1 redoxin domain-containing protein [Myroides pelagicus]